jgi:hypothetical protein
MDQVPEEGWYTDPYERHEARWLSNGMSTKLVRDGGTESYDDPLDSPPTAIPVRVPAEGRAAADGGDLRRADDAERGGPYDPQKAEDAAEIGIVSSTGF